MANWTDELSHNPDVVLRINTLTLLIHISDNVPVAAINELTEINKKAGFQLTSERPGLYGIHVSFPYNMCTLQDAVAKMFAGHGCVVTKH
jgi:hypothetical protein